MSNREWSLSAIAVALLIVLSVAFTSPRTTKTVSTGASSPAPVFNWKLVMAQDFAMQPGESRKQVEGKMISADGEVKLVVSAAHPVSFGFDTLDSTGGHILCGASAVYAASPSCDLEEGAIGSFFIQDERKPNIGDAALGVGALLLGKDSKPITNATETNRVKLEIFAWTCIANCAP